MSDITARKGFQTAWQFALLCMSGVVFSSPFAGELSVDNAQQIPHVGSKARESFSDYVFADTHKAFAIAPGGTWAWVSSQENRETAQSRALKQCGHRTQQQCVPYAVDEEVVFDKENWSQLWGPYKTADEVKSTPEGTTVGRRFPDLSLTTVSGKKHALNDFRGRVVILHFWGSWCPPCCRELPNLDKFYKTLHGSGSKIELIMIPVREKFDVSANWLKEQKLDLSIYDAGVNDSENGAALKLANGDSIPDRAVARVFPATYVLDKHGVIVFSHLGPINQWDEYAPFLKDVMEKSGK